METTLTEYSNSSPDWPKTSLCTTVTTVSNEVSLFTSQSAFSPPLYPPIKDQVKDITVIRYKVFLNRRRFDSDNINLTFFIKIMKLLKKVAEYRILNFN